MTLLQQKPFIDPSEIRVDAWDLYDDKLDIIFYDCIHKSKEYEINREILEQDLMKRGIQPILDQLNPTITYQYIDDEVQYRATIKLDKKNLLKILPILSNLYQQQEYPWINDDTTESYVLFKEASFGFAYNIQVDWDIRNRRLEINHLEEDCIIIYEDGDPDQYEIYSESPNEWRQHAVTGLLASNGYGEYESIFALLEDKTIQIEDLGYNGLYEVWVDF